MKFEYNGGSHDGNLQKNSHAIEIKLVQLSYANKSYSFSEKKKISHDKKYIVVFKHDLATSKVANVLSSKLLFRLLQPHFCKSECVFVCAYIYSSLAEQRQAKK